MPIPTPAPDKWQVAQMQLNYANICNFVSDDLLAEFRIKALDMGPCKRHHVSH